METALQYDQLLDSATKVDTTTGTNGYPRHLRVAYTADTMSELRDLKEAAEAAGHRVDVIRLHRRDGWALWERGSWSGLEDDEWLGVADTEWTITITPGTDRNAEAFDLVCGEGFEVTDADHLATTAQRVKELAAELPDPSALEEGERVIVFLDDYHRVRYTVQTGQNGYAYDTHQHCTALLVTERDADNDNEA